MSFAQALATRPIGVKITMETRFPELIPKKLTQEEVENIKSYLLVMEHLKAMLNSNIILESDFIKAESILAAKYHIKDKSVLRPSSLLSSSFRAMNVCVSKEEES